MNWAGSCVCGAVSYRAQGEAFYVGNCYCRCCRKESGTGHATDLALAEEAVAVTGELTRHTRIADSGAAIESHFCPRCGTTIYARAAAFPGVLLIRAGTLDGDTELSPQMNLFVGHAPAWDPPSPMLPGFAGMPPA